MMIGSSNHPHSHSSLKRTTRTVEKAVQDHAWVGFQYEGKDVTLIPAKLKGELLQGVRASDSQFRSYRLDKMEHAHNLGCPKPAHPRGNDGVLGQLKAAIADDSQVTIAYQLPSQSNPVSLTIDPESFVTQPDKTLAVDARVGDNPHPRHFRVDRILSAE